MSIPNKLGDCFEANGEAFLHQISRGKFPKTNIAFADNSSCHTTQLGGDVPPTWTKEGISDIIKEGKDTWRLIHCQPLFTDGEPYAHCWIENDQMVLDFTSHRPFYKVVSIKTEYYFDLLIPPADFKDEWKGKEEHYKWFSYTEEDIHKIVDSLKSKMHWGAWDFECIR